MKAVKLLKPYKHYNEGEIAGFGEAVNRQLVEAGVAEEFVERKVKGATKKSASGDGSDQSGVDGGQGGADGDQAGGDNTTPDGE